MRWVLQGWNTPPDTSAGSPPIRGTRAGKGARLARKWLARMRKKGCLPSSVGAGTRRGPTREAIGQAQRALAENLHEQGGHALAQARLLKALRAGRGAGLAHAKETGAGARLGASPLGRFQARAGAPIPPQQGNSSLGGLRRADSWTSCWRVHGSKPTRPSMRGTGGCHIACAASALTGKQAS